MPFAQSGSISQLLVVAGFVGRDENGEPIDGIEPQTRRTLQRIEEHLNANGIDRQAIRRLRIYLTDVGDWASVHAILEEWFAAAIPASAAVGVAGLVEPWMRIEIEADADLSG